MKFDEICQRLSDALASSSEHACPRCDAQFSYSTSELMDIGSIVADSGNGNWDFPLLECDNPECDEKWAILAVSFTDSVNVLFTNERELNREMTTFEDFEKEAEADGGR